MGSRPEIWQAIVQVLARMADLPRMGAVHSTSSRETLGVRAAASTNASPRISDEHKHGIGVLGATLTVLLTPVIVIAFAVAMLGLIGALTGWSPPILKQTLSIDPLVEGDGFTKHRVIMIVVGLTVGYIAAAMVRWAVHFRRDDETTAPPMSRRTA